jgi:hypothetical protein
MERKGKVGKWDVLPLTDQYRCETTGTKVRKRQVSDGFMCGEAHFTLILD